MKSQHSTHFSRLLQDAVDSFTTAVGVDGLWRCLHQQLGSFGIAEVIYGVEPAPDPTREVSPLLNSITPAWLDNKLALRLFECDEYVRSARAETAITPMLWSDQSLIEAMSPEAKLSFSLDMDYGVLCGVSIPMRFAGKLGASSIGLHAKGLALPDFDRIWLDHANSIMAIVNAFDVTLRQQHIGHVFPLSTQERECLLWIAAGLKPMQIADRLRLTDKQVEKRLTKARHKLKALTMPQAIATALIFGLIDP